MPNKSKAETDIRITVAAGLFAIVAENEAYNQNDWRTRTLTGFLQIVTVA